MHKQTGLPDSMTGHLNSDSLEQGTDGDLNMTNSRAKGGEDGSVVKCLQGGPGLDAQNPCKKARCGGMHFEALYWGGTAS